jgi:catalase
MTGHAWILRRHKCHEAEEGLFDWVGYNIFIQEGIKFPDKLNRITRCPRRNGYDILWDFVFLIPERGSAHMFVWLMSYTHGGKA